MLMLIVVMVVMAVISVGQLVVRVARFVLLFVSESRMLNDVSQRRTQTFRTCWRCWYFQTRRFVRIEAWQIVVLVQIV
jgi:hypothetical protein